MIWAKDRDIQRAEATSATAAQVFQNIKRELWNIPQLMSLTETSVGDTDSKPGLQRSHFCIRISQGRQEVRTLLCETTKCRGCWLLAAKLSQIIAYYLTPLLPELWRSCLCREFSEGSQRGILVKPCLFFPIHFPKGTEWTLQLRSVTLSGKN